MSMAMCGILCPPPAVPESIISSLDSSKRSVGEGSGRFGGIPPPRSSNHDSIQLDRENSFGRFGDNRVLPSREVSSVVESDDCTEITNGDCCQSNATRTAACSTDVWTAPWANRYKRIAIPDERAHNPQGVTALKSALRGFAEKRLDKVINPNHGTTFDTLQEAYEFYNMYSWENGFGVRYGRSRLNVKNVKCMQELVCGCAGKPRRQNSSSCRCECPAMVRLLRTEDKGWYIALHKDAHNHKLLDRCCNRSIGRLTGISMHTPGT